jgi:tRNA(Ile2) C34 agmatinyltransferase TiaS
MVKDGRLDQLHALPRFGPKAANWKGGNPRCIYCGVELSARGFKRCQKCYLRLRHPRSKITGRFLKGVTERKNRIKRVSCNL